MGWLSAAFLVSIPINFGLLAWGAWVVEAGDGSCWSSDDKKMPGTLPRSACLACNRWHWRPSVVCRAGWLCVCCPLWLQLVLLLWHHTQLSKSAGAAYLSHCIAATIFFGGLGVPVGQL